MSDYIQRIRDRLKTIAHNPDEPYRYIDQEKIARLSGVSIPDDLKFIISEDACLKMVWRWYEEDVKLLLGMLDLDEGRGTKQ